MDPRLLPARTAHDIDIVRVLFAEYADGLGIDLAFQGFEAELARLPGRYRAPGGRLLLARSDGSTTPGVEALGCVGIRPTERPGTCEIKRLYVRPAGRGTGIGRALAAGAIEFAADAGYDRVVLDTLPVMKAAIALYRVLGFEPIAAYGDNVLPGMLFFGRGLGVAKGQAAAPAWPAS